MAFKYKEFTLYKKEVTLRSNNKTYPLYYFAKGTPKSGSPAEKPEGYEIYVNQKTGCPFLKLSKGRVSGWQKRKKRKIINK